MSGPDTAGMRSELAAALRGHRWQQVGDLFRCSCGYIPEDTPSIEDHRAGALLPVVQLLAVEKAAEELRAAADGLQCSVFRCAELGNGFTDDQQWVCTQHARGNQS